MNDVKHRLCYLSLDFDAELALTRFKGKKNTIKREFVLPDFVNTFHGRDELESPVLNPADEIGHAFANFLTPRRLERIRNNLPRGVVRQELAGSRGVTVVEQPLLDLFRNIF